MKLNLRRIVISLAGVVAGTGMAAGTVVGCSGDDSVAPGGEAGADVTQDVTQDVQPHPDGMADGAADVQPDAMPDSTPDVGVDAPPLAAFPRAIAVAFCARLAECCLNPTTFDQPKCLAALDNPTNEGFVNTATYEPFLDGGNVNYNPTLAAKCIMETRQVACGLVASAEAKAIQADCFGAMTGKLAVGATGCRGSIECVTASHCSLPDGGDAGGTCTALSGIGGACTNTSTSDECTYLGNGAPPNYCNGSTCAAAKDLDASCGSNAECKSGICFVRCVDHQVFSDPGVPNGICDYFSIHDAGGGG